MFGYDMYTWISIFITVALAGFTAIYLYCTKNDNYWKKRGVPYVPRNNIIKIIRLLNSKPINEIMKQDIGKYERAIGSFEFTTPSFVLTEPDLLRDVLVKDFHKFHDRRDVNLGNGDSILLHMVTNLKGEDWKRVRTIITPAFTSKRMRTMGSIINECSKSVTDVLEKTAKEDKPIECKGLFGAFAMDVIARAAFGTQIDSHNDSENIFVKYAKENFISPSMIKLLLFMIFPVKMLVKLKLIKIGGEDFFKNVITQVVKKRKETGKRYNDILQVLMDVCDENEHLLNSEIAEDETDRYGSIMDSKDKKTPSSLKYKKLSEIELLAQCVLFFVVGYETTASTLAFMAYALAMNPEWQEKLIEEVDKAFEKHGEMSHDTVREMKVLEAVVSETLRMYPVAIVLVRTANEDYELGNTGIVIEKGMAVTIPVYGMHYDPEFFEDPETFNPNRFMDPSEMKHPQYAYLPFGAGPRNCLGMRFALLEMKVCMANILRHFRFRRHPKTQVPLKYKLRSALLSTDGMHLAVEKRTDVK